MKVALVCNECGSRNYKATQTDGARIELKKYCKKCNRHTIHKSSI